MVKWRCDGQGFSDDAVRNVFGTLREPHYYVSTDKLHELKHLCLGTCKVRYFIDFLEESRSPITSKFHVDSKAIVSDSNILGKYLDDKEFRSQDPKSKQPIHEYPSKLHNPRQFQDGRC